MKNISFDKSIKTRLPLIMAMICLIAAIALFIFRLNIISVINAILMCISALSVFLGVVIKKKLYAGFIGAFISSAASIFVYYTVWGADAGFGAFFDNSINGNLFTRILGNFILLLPSFFVLVAVIISVKKSKKNYFLSAFLSLVLILTSVFHILTMNLRSVPNVERLWDGHDEYLNKIDKNSKGKPNVLFILMDDMGWGDTSLNGAIYNTPNMDSIGENGINFDNFYSSYSVCSPARFALMTGRYPYRGYADNVIYPTVNSFSPFAATRLFNSFEMGANADGMLGDEITIAEVFQNAGYNTGAFGKWHLGDYGEYLPTNQGFDYFYGSHYANDMTPFYHVSEKDGNYEIAHDSDELKDQSKATEWIHEELTEWITDSVKNSDNPFFAYYASPWPHAPLYAGDDFDGASGMGTYVDCLTEFDTYLGKLFDTLDDLDVLDDTIIIFTSDNGPALEGSVAELRGGKYLAYEGGQKVPCMIRWDNNNGLWKDGTTLTQSATLVDFFPTLIELCGISGNNGEKNYLPSDRKIDGVSMLKLLTNDEVIHNEDNPILYMKREDLKSIQYTVKTEDILSQKEYADYKYPVLKDNEYISFKYFQNIQNDNSAFFDKYRKNWLHILNDDSGENYNRSSVYPTVADDMNKKMDEIMSDFKSNRRGKLQ